MTKECGECRRVLPLTEFYRQASTVDGLNRYCKFCCKIQRAQARVKARDKKKGISYRQLYRARVEHMHTEYDEDITLWTLYRRDRGLCGICGYFVESNLASIDHVTPLSRGGLHKWDNVQLVHVRCNKRKGVRTT